MLGRVHRGGMVAAPDPASMSPAPAPEREAQAGLVERVTFPHLLYQHSRCSQWHVVESNTVPQRAGVPFANIGITLDPFHRGHYVEADRLALGPLKCQQPARWNGPRGGAS